VAIRSSDPRPTTDALALVRRAWLSHVVPPGLSRVDNFAAGISRTAPKSRRRELAATIHRSRQRESRTSQAKHIVL